MTIVVAGNRDRSALRDEIERAKTRAMKPRGADLVKLNADKCAMIAAQYEVVTKVPGLNGRVFRNPPGRIALLFKRALPAMIETGRGVSMLRTILYGWSAGIDFAKRNKCGKPVLWLYQGQIKLLKELATGEQAEA